MKARDIIPGWPRSRTSMRVTSNECRIEMLAFRAAHLRLFANLRKTQGLKVDTDLLRAELRSEILIESTYQQMQQFRLNAWFEYWRNPGALNIFVPDVTTQVSFRLLETNFHKHFLQLMSGGHNMERKVK